MLIITCPCALALAVPAVQVLASGRLLRQGMLLKSATALERFAEADMVVFDKTGTLTSGRLELVADRGRRRRRWRRRPGMAKASRHPLARALAARRAGAPVPAGVEEVAGCGLRLARPEGEWRLGRRDWAAGVAEDDAVGRRAVARAARRTRRCGSPSPTGCARDAAAVVAALQRRGYAVALLSGDREPTVRRVAAELGIADWQAGCTPAAKTAPARGAGPPRGAGC